MNIDDGNYYDLDDVASSVWQRIAEPTRVNALCDELAAEFEGERATIEHDVLVLLRELAARALIEVRVE